MEASVALMSTLTILDRGDLVITGRGEVRGLDRNRQGVETARVEGYSQEIRGLEALGQAVRNRSGWEHGGNFWLSSCRLAAAANCHNLFFKCICKFFLSLALLFLSQKEA